MATFLMFGKYSTEALRGIRPERTDEFIAIVKRFGGDVKAIYQLLGEVDLVCIVAFPGIEQAMQASVALGKLTGISFTTLPAITVEEFDKLMAEV
ncbi:MAG: GYD domain-containing protein [Proteobacteria bacterium]|nr:GYD domain-containing protein [Pseudomonadota bacterium]NIS69118.1 GYD domain-containing protein [Pseudomonadota bacterium]